jgi:hypothetical protein
VTARTPGCGCHECPGNSQITRRPPAQPIHKSPRWCVVGRNAAPRRRHRPSGSTGIYRSNWSLVCARVCDINNEAAANTVCSIQARDRSPGLYGRVHVGNSDQHGASRFAPEATGDRMTREGASTPGRSLHAQERTVHLPVLEGTESRLRRVVEDIASPGSGLRCLAASQPRPSALLGTSKRQGSRSDDSHRLIPVWSNVVSPARPRPHAGCRHRLASRA